MRTIPALVAAAAAEQPSKPFLFFEDEVYSYGELKGRMDAAAAALHSFGIRRGNHVALVVPNSPAFLFSWLGLARIGAVMVPVNPVATDREIATVLSRSRPLAALGDPLLTQRVERIVARAQPDIRVLSTTELLVGDASEGIDAEIYEGDPAVLLPTSGTTGTPKLVIQSHRSYVLAGEGFPHWLGLNESDRLFTALPLFHINAQVYSFLGALAAGASLAMVRQFSARLFWEQVTHFQATQFNSIGAMLEILMRQPHDRSIADTRIRLCYTAPAPVKERHIEMEQRFGLRLLVGYALSESPYGTIWPLEGSPPYGSIGKPRQHPTLGRINSARVADETGNPVSDGEVGELLLKNPAVMDGYFGMVDETNAALKDGWLRTGDLVWKGTDGNFYFEARKKEIIRRRGENLAPAEVEQVLEAHPDVETAAVIGVPSELTEEDVKAFVVLHSRNTTDAEALHSWCADRLSGFKVPRYWEFVPELPLTSTGRIAKHELSADRTQSERDLQTD